MVPEVLLGPRGRVVHLPPDDLDGEVLACVLFAIEIRVHRETLPGTAMGEIVENRRAEAATAGKAEEQRHQRNRRQATLCGHTDELSGVVDRNRRYHPSCMEGPAIGLEPKLPRKARETNRGDVQQERDALPLEVIHHRCIKMPEAFRGPRQLPITWWGRHPAAPQRARRAAQEAPQRRVLGDPQHPLLRETEVDAISGQAAEALHVILQPRTVEHACADPVAGEVARVRGPAVEQTRDHDRREHAQPLHRAGGDKIGTEREGISCDRALRGELGPGRLDRDVTRKHLRKVRQERRVVLEDEASDVERVSFRGVVEMVPTDVGVFVDHQHPARTLAHQDRRRDEPGHSGPDNDRVIGRRATLGLPMTSGWIVHGTSPPTDHAQPPPRRIMPKHLIRAAGADNRTLWLATGQPNGPKRSTACSG